MTIPEWYLPGAINVKRIRKEYKMTQENLAWATELDISTIKRLEGQKFNASVMNLCIIASVLNVDISKRIEIPIRTS